MESIPKIRNQLEYLAHVQIQYFSTFKSYGMISKVFQVISYFLHKEIFSRNKEMTYFTTDQGIGLRKIMLEHYQNIQRQLGDTFKILKQITFQIDQKHQSMQNSIHFVQSVIDEIVRKNQVLRKQKQKIQKKIQNIDKRKRPNQGSHSSQVYIKKKQNIDFLSPFFLQKQVSGQNARKKLFNQKEILEVKELLQLKLMEVQKFIKIQNQINQRIIQKIYNILDLNLGKGLEMLQRNILEKIKLLSSSEFNISPKVQNKYQNQNSQTKRNEIDLKCYESINDLMDQNLYIQRFLVIRKKLYDNSRKYPIYLQQSIEQKSEAEEDQIQLKQSPTFNYFSPLIGEVQGININKFQIQQNLNKVVLEHQSQQRMSSSELCSNIYQSFSSRKNGIFNDKNNENIDSSNI